MPGPASSTSSTADAPSARSRTWTGWSAGDHLPALSMRLSTARWSAAGRPLTHTEVTSSATSMSGTRERARVAAATTTSARSSSSVLSSLTSPRARSVSSAARVLNSATWAPRSLSSRVRLSAGSALSRVPRRSSRISSSTLRRRLVSGVLSSWAASSASSRWARRESRSAASMSLIDWISRRISPPPSSGMSASRSRVCATRTAAAVSRSIGASPVRATVRPTRAPPTTQSSPISSMPNPNWLIGLSSATRATWTAPSPARSV